MLETERFEIPEETKKILDAMREAGYVWVKEDELEAPKLKERYLRRSSLTYKQIADARIWGDIGKKAVEAIVKKKFRVTL